jgi:sterol desaturase/sphingolipid hydroxylase (fatty acid hydroxylase superfamily)
MRDPTLLTVAVSLIALALLFGLVERLIPANRTQKTIRPGITTDLIYWFTTPFLTRAVSRVGIIVALVPLFALLGRPLSKESLLAGHGLVATWAPGAQAIAMIVIGDFVGYWTHRAFHTGRAWRVHAVHHSSEQLDWLAAVRVHPLNDLVNRVIQAIVLLGIGFSPLSVAAYQPFLTLYAIFLHANVRVDFGPLRYLVATPAFHRWHHTSQAEGRDRNFAGLLPLWDWLFGTLYLPSGSHATRFGVDGSPLPRTWLGQLLYPFHAPPM